MDGSGDVRYNAATPAHATTREGAYSRVDASAAHAAQGALPAVLIGDVGALPGLGWADLFWISRRWSGSTTMHHDKLAL